MTSLASDKKCLVELKTLEELSSAVMDLDNP